MTMKSNHSRKTLALAGGGVLLLVVGAWGVSSYYRETPQAPSPIDPAKLREEMHRPDLTEEQRHQLAQSFHDFREAEMDKRMKDYFSASPEEQEKILDQQIDQMQEERKQRAAEHEREGEQHRRDRDPTSRPFRRYENTTPQERKQASESRSPDQRAQRMAYFAAMRARMQARGIQGGSWGRGGGRGGPGGGGGGGGRF